MNSELKQDLTELLRLSLVDDEFIDQYIDDITALLKYKVSGRMGIYIGKKKGFCQKILNTNIMTSISTGMKMRLLWMETVIQA